MKENSNDKPITLKNPCIVDIDTKAGLLSLMMDKEFPQYLFVSFNGELRKCVELNRKPSYPIENDEDVFDFLHSLKHSSIIQAIIEQEENLDQSWNEL